MYKYTDKKKEHLHTLDEKPLIGTSSVVGVVAKPLTWWASGLAVSKLGWISDKDKQKRRVDPQLRLDSAEAKLKEIKDMSSSEYLKLLDEAYRAHSVSLKDSAQGGVDLHAELERFVKDHMARRDGAYDPKIIPFVNWCHDNVDKFLWSEMNCYSREHWVGGISDVGVKLKTGECGILDFKSSREAYPTQFFQVGGYDIEISENGGFNSDGDKIFELTEPISFYGIVPFGAEHVEPVISYDVTDHKRAFLYCLGLYKILNTFKI